MIPEKAFKKNSLKKNFAWGLAGNVIFNLSQWLNLAILTKFLNPSEVGSFALAMATCAPIIIFSTLRMNVTQVTDVAKTFTVSDFLGLQSLTGALAVTLLFCYSLFNNIGGTELALLIAAAVAQLIVAFKEILLGVAQQKERMDIVATSKILSSCISLATLLLFLPFLPNALTAFVLLTISRLIALLAWDVSAVSPKSSKARIPEQRKNNWPRFNVAALTKIVKKSLPLGVASMLHSVAINVPKYQIAFYISEDQLAYFVAITALSMTGKMAIQAAVSTTLPRLSNTFVTDRRAFIKLLSNLILFSIIIGIAGVSFSHLFGSQVLRLAFSPEYARHSELLTTSMATVMIAYLSTIFSFALSAASHQSVHPVGCALAGIATFATGCYLVPQFGLYGATYSIGIGALVETLIFASTLLLALRLPHRSTKEKI